MKTSRALLGGLFSPCKLLIVLFLMLFTGHIFAQVDYFTLDVDDMFGLWYSDSDFGDYDNDNDLDLMMVGYGAGGAAGQGFMKFYRNDGPSLFTLTDSQVLGVGNGTVRFADLDGDNDLDVFVCGQYLFGVDTTRVYINNEGVFSDCGYNFPPRVSSSVSFGDYDNDGDLDILVTGGTIDDVSTGYIEIYRNEGSFMFTPITVFTPGIRSGMAEFGDYNSDGWLDIAVTGDADDYITQIYKGSSTGDFTLVPVQLLGLRYSRVAWVDYDCDGDLDLMVSGSYVNESPSVYRLYRNEGNDAFEEVTQAAVIGERQGDMAWGDFNNDGYPDVCLNGLITNTTTVANVYLYNPTDGLYVDAQTMIYLKYACMTLGDYNNDTRLDMSLSGHYSSGNYWNDLYINEEAAINTPPTPPAGLVSLVVGSDVTLIWDSATDTQTPAPGLTYNVRVGTTPGGNDIMSSMAVAETGWRKVVRPGNNWQALTKNLLNLPDGTYYWSVQAIDNTFAGSVFATEETFTVGEVSNNDVTMPQISAITNYPNPFNPETTVRFNLMQPASVNVSIYNLKGQLVKTLSNGALSAGNHSLVWNGTDNNSRALSSGIYTVRVTTDTMTKTHKLILVK